MTEPTSSFAELGLDPRVLSTLSTLGYEEPTPIQRAAIPPLVEGRDLLGQAATGTGKTAAFALPILHRLSLPDAEETRSPRALVLVPTRELAIQVTEAIGRYGRELPLRVVAIYGGQPMFRQLHALERGVDIAVATPGRALDHLRRGSLALDHIAVLVLDEADEMLDMGFAEDLEAILEATPAGRQTALFSATMPRQIRGIAHRHLRDPAEIQISTVLAEGEAAKVRQIAYLVHRPQKVASLVRVLDLERPTSALVFCRRRIDVEELTEALVRRGYDAEPLHGGLSQLQRDTTMRRFRDGTIQLLVATDVAARGLDISQLSHVVNHDVPASADDYVHRIGRTGRAGREGVAITLIEPRELRLVESFARITHREITIARVPSVAELRARRLSLTQAALEELLLAGGLEELEPVVAALAEQHGLERVALAAVKLAHRATLGEHEEVEIPSPPLPRPPPPRRPLAERPARDRNEERPARRGEKRTAPPRASSAEGSSQEWPTVQLFVSVGREAGVGPGDLVGAIANESGLSSKAIGAIEVGERHSLVEVPEEIADELIGVLSDSKIRGRKFKIRRHDGRRTTSAEPEGPEVATDAPRRPPRGRGGRGSGGPRGRARGGPRARAGEGARTGPKPRGRGGPRGRGPRR